MEDFSNAKQKDLRIPKIQYQKGELQFLIHFSFGGHVIKGDFS